MHKHFFRSSVFSIGAVAFSLSLGAVNPAQAGFKWVGSDEVQSARVSVAAPVSGSGTPVIITATDEKPSEITSPAVRDDAIVRGFADSIPLSVALRQVLPPGIGFSTAQDVNLNTLVSWRGGAPWRQVLTDMLTGAGLMMKDEGGQIHIARSAGGFVPASAPLDSRPMALLPSAQNSLSSPAPQALASASGYLMPPTSAYAPSSYDPGVAVGSWAAVKGDMLQKVLEGWGKRANVEISWQAEYDYPLQASVSLDGSFEQAVRDLLAGFQEAKPQPIGYLYNNQSAGQTVLVIQTRGNNYTE